MTVSAEFVARGASDHGSRLFAGPVLALVAAVLIPTSLFSAGFVYLYLESERATIEARVVDQAASVSRRIDAEVEARARAMAILAGARSLSGPVNVETFRERAESRTDQTWSSILLADPVNGRLLTDTEMPADAPPTTAPAIASLLDMRRLGRPMLSDLQPRESLRADASVVLWTPVPPEGDARLAIGSVARSAELHRLTAPQGLPDGTVVAILDRQKTIVARNQSQDRFVGNRATASLAAAIERSEAGLFPAMTLEGERVYTAFHRSAATGWSVALGVPAAVIDDPLRQSFLAIGAAAVSALLLASLLGGLAARDLIRRRAADERLRSTEALLRAFVDNTVDGIFYIRVRQGGGFVFDGHNRAFAEGAGISADETIGKTPDEVLPRPVASALRARFDECIASRQPISYEDVRFPGGRRRVWDTVLVPIIGASGVVERLVGTARDVTAQRDAEDRLRRSEERYSALFERSPLDLFIMRLTSDGRLVYEEANAAYYRATGFTPERLIGHSLQDLYEPGLATFLEAKGRECLETGQPVEYDAEVRLPVGRVTRHVRLVPLSGDDGQVAHVFGSAIDVTEQRRVADALRRSEENYRTLYNKTPMALHSVDSAARLVSVNDYWVQLFGYRRDEVLGRLPTDFMTPESAQHYHVNAWPEFLRSSGIRTHEYRFVAKDGRLIDIRLSAQAARDGEGRLVRSWAVLEDVTRMRHAEESLRQAQKMEAIGQLTGGVAHDFNNLLTAVIGNLELIQRRAGDPVVLRLSENAVKAAERGARLTEQLLAFARRQHLQIEPVDMNAVVLGMRDLLARTIGGLVTVSINLDPEAKPALADRTQIELAILNLAINARDAMPNGGTLTIATKRLERGHFEVDARDELPPGEYLLVEVVDTGTGMSGEVLDKAFEPFFTTKEVGKGSGLGLSQVYGVIRQCGGTVGIDSRVGKGTAIRLYLPMPTGNEATAATVVPPVGPIPLEHRGVRHRLLVVDDEESVRSFAVEALTEAGFDVIASEDAADAERQVDGERMAGRVIDGAVIDFAMPGLNGAELARRLEKSCPGIALLMVTGYADADTLSSVTEGRPIPVLTKPFRASELALRVAELIQSRISASP